jgi:hypothetical protein
MIWPEANDGPSREKASMLGRGFLAVGVMLVAQGAGGAPALPRVVVLGRQPNAGVSAAARTYLEAFRSVGYPVELAGEGSLGSVGDAVLVVPLATAGVLDGEVCGRVASFVEGGGKLVTAGPSPLSRALGVRFADERLEVAAVRETRSPDLVIRWKAACAFQPFVSPAASRTHALAGDARRPIVASFRHDRGTVLFLGVELGDESTAGTARFPYLLQDVGEAFEIQPPLALHRLTVYADIGDHPREDPAALARRWHRRGIREVHLGTWQGFDANEASFSALIAACHRYGILVYAWLELPEVSTAFWDAHPEWREKTATGADAHVDWRRLMALDAPECFGAVAQGVLAMLERHDWDGVDLAEIYYESPTGLDAPELFTPMNTAAREEFARRGGFDPQELFAESSPRFWKKDPAALDAFLAYRRDKIVEFHERLMGLLASARQRKPGLDLVLTLVDALYDTSMHDRIAIDPERITRLVVKDAFALQVEDPYTLWALGPERYGRIAADYRRLIGPAGRLSIDINVVPRGEEVVPTSQQTGLELYRLVSEARRAFPKVCIYSEGTIYPLDFSLLPNALAATASVQPQGKGAVLVESEDGVELATGHGSHAVTVDGVPWPALRERTVLVPKGRHLVEWQDGPPEGGGMRLREINAVLLGAAAGMDFLSVRYASAARAFLTLSFRPARAEVDGSPATLAVEATEHGFVVTAPPGEHALKVFRK